MSRILRYIPNPLRIRYAIVSQEIRRSEQEGEESMGVLRRKRLGKKSVYKDVAGWDRRLDIVRS
jgi:hypothetical protein